MTEQSEKNIECERCGAEFKCGVETGDCWCFLLPLDQNTLNELNAEFDNCLCPKCLLENQKKAVQNS